jgi:hypothetical protein
MYRQPKEQAFEVRKTNQAAATWKVFAMVRLLTFEFRGAARLYRVAPLGMMG